MIKKNMLSLNKEKVLLYRQRLVTENVVLYVVRASSHASLRQLSIPPHERRTEKYNTTIMQGRARDPAAEADENPAALQENGQHRLHSAPQPFHRAAHQASREDCIRRPLAGLHVVHGG